MSFSNDRKWNLRSHDYSFVLRVLPLALQPSSILSFLYRPYLNHMFYKRYLWICEPPRHSVQTKVWKISFVFLSLVTNILIQGFHFRSVNKSIRYWKDQNSGPFLKKVPNKVYCWSHTWLP